MAGQDAYDALRGQRTARTAGWHPYELVEPGVQGRLVALSRLGPGAPSPSLTHLRLHALLRRPTGCVGAGEEGRGEEEGERDAGVLRAKDRGVPEFALPVLFVLFSEEKEQEEKKKLPKTSSRSSRAP